jgi:nucleotide-binding universal stress UspA family protein
MPKLRIRRILVPLDFSKSSMYALDHAAHMAKRYAAEITLLHAVESVPVVTERGYFDAMAYAAEYEKALTGESEKHLAAVAARIRKKSGGEVRCLTATGRAYAVVTETAKKIKAHIVVMGTHGVTGFREFFIGSNAYRVVQEARCPVLTISRAANKPGFSNILVPFRDKPHSREKVDYAIDLARTYGAAVHVLAVDPSDSRPGKRKLQLEASQILRFIKQAGLAGTLRIVTGLYHADVVLKHARARKCDLIISMSDSDRMDISEYFKGPYAQQIVNHSPIPVLSIRPTFNPDTIDLRFY